MRAIGILAIVAVQVGAGGVGASPPFGAWTVEARTSALDGTGNLTATIASRDRTPDPIGRPAATHITVICSRGRLGMVVAPPHYVTGRRSQVTWRSGDAALRSAAWDVRGGRVVVSDPEAAWAFLDSLDETGDLVVGVGQVHEASFAVTGAAQVVARLRTDCPRR